MCFFVSSSLDLVPLIADYGGKNMQEFYETCRDDFKYPSFWRDCNITCAPHFHSSIELIYITEGSLKAVVNGEPHIVEQNQILISSSYTAHYYSQEKQSHSILLIVPLDFIPSYGTVLSKKVFCDCICRDQTVNREVLHGLEQLLSLKECSESTANIIKGYIYVIIGLIVNSVGLTDSGEQDNSLLQDILKYLQNNYLTAVSLDILSRDFGYSKYRFSHIFSTCFGCSLTEYVNTLRARHAANLLTETETPLIDVAMNSGFESMRTFYRAFKLCFGVTPSQYRSNYIANQ